ncbi:MAG TPA: hypothetical protein VMZ52_04480 [Bryobacteraceae bacterium]|nr:hypothetical protein [Bryobacteraceae bacterium]
MMRIQFASFFRRCRVGSVLLLSGTLCSSAAPVITTGEIVERDGIPRHGSLVEQGIPVSPLPEAEARKLVLRRADGKPMSSVIDVDAHDQDGKVRWLRVSAVVDVGARGRIPVRIESADGAASPKLDIRKSPDGVQVKSRFYDVIARNPGQIEISTGGKQLLGGDWSVDLISDARGIIWGTYFRDFTAQGVSVETESSSRVTLLLRGYFGKNQRKNPKVAEGQRKFDCELRLYLNAISPQIRFAWRLTNVTGTKTWLERYALRLPVAQGMRASERTTPDRILLDAPGGGRLAVTADFIDDLGKGAGMRLDASGHLLFGGLEMPADGGFFSGRVPDVHRLFYNGMSRTFTGTLVTTGSLSDAAEERAPLDLVLPPQYYSDVKALPEQGDPVTFGEFEPAVRRSAEWLLKSQWRGTLLWGEWYREWDMTRNMGVEEASNGHSPLAPLYHYWRTGDARFLRCAERSANYVWDVQLSKSEEDQGRMFHTRRHLFDELDWIHPRYQRATGAIVMSHVLLNPVMRNEAVRTVRSYHEHMFDDNGVPHDWDKIRHKRSDVLAGVDTSNFMEALTYCYRETGDRQYLDWALQMSRWTAENWALRGKAKGNDWNWNLTNYVLRGLLPLYESSGDAKVRDLAIDISRKTLANTGTNGMELMDGVGGGELHFVFYHAYLSARISKLAPDGPEMTRQLLSIVRREVARQTPDGQFPMKHGTEAGRETVWTSYYDPKSLVAYVPVLAAHLAARH